MTVQVRRQHNKLKSILIGALIAALYSIATAALAPISYGPVQFRVSEAMTLLPFYMSEAVPGLFVGCIIANFLGGNGIWDVLIGSLATLAAAWLSLKALNLWQAALYPVLVNMLLVGGMLHFLTDLPLWSTCLWVGLGEAGSCFLVGIPLMRYFEKKQVFDYWRSLDAGGKDLMD